MKTLISFSCIYFFVVAQDQYSFQTTKSFQLGFAKELYRSGDSKYFDISDLKDKIIFMDDIEIKNAYNEHKERTNQNNHTIHNIGISAFLASNNKTNDSVTLFPVKDVHNYEANIEDVKLTSKSNETDINTSNKFNDLTVEKSSMPCTEKNERYPVSGSCDSYIECQNGKAEKKQCPDGLRYNQNAKSDEYPCQYPAEIKCIPGSILQPPNPTDLCPNQFGYFKTEDRFNCTSYRICENGIGYDFNCPEGLAYNALTSRCEWADRVPECNVEALHDFRCPDVPTSNKNLNLSKSYRSPKNCTVYFSCANRKPHRLECEEFFAFDEVRQTCVPAFEVEQCTTVQRHTARLFVKRDPNGGYLINTRDDYLQYRVISLSFKPKIKSRPKPFRNLI